MTDDAESFYDDMFPRWREGELPPVESDLERIRLELEQWQGPMTLEDYERIMGW